MVEPTGVPVAYLLLVGREESVLVVRSFVKREWHLPLAYAEPGELPRSAARRTAEEFGLTLSVANLERVHFCHVLDGEADVRQTILLFVPMRWEGFPDVSKLGEGFARWVTPDDYRTVLPPWVEQVLHSMTEGLSYSEFTLAAAEPAEDLLGA